MPKTTFLSDYKAPSYLIDTVDLQFDLDDQATRVSAHLWVRANPELLDVEPDLELNGEELTLKYVTLNGVPLRPEQYEQTNTSLIIKNVPKAFSLAIQNEINPAENTSLSGLYKSNGAFTTQCEAEGFRRITYFLDRPDVMACYTTTIIADEKQYPVLLSNGNFIEQSILDNGKKRVKWADPFKKPSYLYALVAGDFDLVEDNYLTQSGRRIQLQIFVEKGYSDRCVHAMDALKNAMRWDEEHYGRECDLESYKIVAVSNFNAGAMENKGLNIFNSKYILATPETATDHDHLEVEATIGHEYFHNWTGNRITCREWFQLSLKEGLTTFREQSFIEDISSVAARIHAVEVLRDGQFIEDQGPLAHPVQPQSYIDIDNFYTHTVYNKGAEIFRMLRTTLGKKVFRKGMDLYFERHDGQAVRIEDYIKVMEETSGHDLSQFLLWFHQAGTPLLEIEDNYDPINQSYRLKIKQSCPPTPGQVEKKPMAIPITMGLIDATGSAMPLCLENTETTEIERVLMVTKAEQEFYFSRVASRPTPSLLRGFSAPVRIHYPYTNDDLRLLARFDLDLFNRYEAANQYVFKYLQQLVHSVLDHQELTLSPEFIDTFRDFITTPIDDLELLSLIISLPSETELANRMERVHVEAIHAVLTFVTEELANEFKSILIKLYETHHRGEYPKEPFDAKESGRRDLKNVVLYYLTRLDNAAFRGRTMEQFQNALGRNMTDTCAALDALIDVDCPERAQALDLFYQQWHLDPQVLDYWFETQAASSTQDTLNKVKELFKHPDFDIKNPNKLFALLGPWTRNLSSFHTASGEGYQFLADMVLKLNAINPQSAASAVMPLTQWKRYDAQRQKLMCQQLRHIMQQEDLEKGVYELVYKSLGDAPEEPVLLKQERFAFNFFGDTKESATTVPGAEDEQSKGYIH